MTYDYIIVGAGSAGCMLASRLTESGKYSMLLSEAGESDDSLLFKSAGGMEYRAGRRQRLLWCEALGPVHSGQVRRQTGSIAVHP
jgi:choline dehydrogenase-like flavoprotein